jgi:hypothetical protein
MPSAILFCSYLTLVKWLQNNLLLCPFKKLTSLDCPGCGFQRSIIYLLEGQINKSVQIYPATLLILTAVLFWLTGKFTYTSSRTKYVFNLFYLFTAAVISGAYLLKMVSWY